MKSGAILRSLGAVVVAAGVGQLYGCRVTSDSTSSHVMAASESERSTPVVGNGTMHSDGPRQVTRGGNDGDGLPASTMIDARPAALVSGRQINWGELRPLLNEAAGAEVLEEFIVDLLLEQQLTAGGITISEHDVTRERELLLRTFSDDRTVAMRLLDQLRTRRGLGEVRFRNLLERNAALRALVADRVSVTEEQVRRVHAIRYGPKRQARLIVLPDLSMAQEAVRRVREGRPFADVAVELSTDSSASRGGLLEPISRADPSYPAALREELWALQVGEISSPVLFNNQYGVLQLVRELSAEDVSFESVRPELEQAARLSQERLLMDELVTRLLNDVSVVIFDETLRAAWKRGAATR